MSDLTGNSERAPRTGVTLGVALVIGAAGVAAALGLFWQLEPPAGAQVPPEAGTTTGAPPAIESTEPGDGATNVSVLVQPAVIFDREIAAETDDAALVLLDESGASVRGAVRPGDDDRSLLFVPAAPLRYAETYVLEIAAPRGVDGATGQEASISFTTSVNPPTSSYYVVGEQLAGYRRYLVSDTGRLLEILSFEAPGNNGRWLDEDDVISWRTTIRYRGDAVTFSADYGHPGGDGRWFTSDDILDRYETQDLDAAGRVVAHWRYADPGNDGVWLNQDDRADSVATVTYGAGGEVARIRVVDDAGADARFLTGDDGVAGEIAYSYDELGRLVRIVQHNGPGPDGTWGNDDDGLIGIRELEYGDSSAAPVRVIMYDYPGADGRWMTDDDSVSSWVRLEYGPSGLTRRVVYGYSGFDGVWFTGDDIVLYYNQISYDRRGLAGRNTFYIGPGPDFSWLTPDDLIGAYDDIRFDASGDRLQRLSASDPGFDHVWLTADDRLNTELRFDPSR